MTSACTFCGQSLGPDPITTATGRFCSQGCVSLAGTLGAPDDPVRHGSPVTQSDEDSAPQSGTTTTFFHVDGMHNATCEAFLESIAHACDGVQRASASYITETIRIDHDPSRTSEAELQDSLTVLGYTATDPATTPRGDSRLPRATPEHVASDRPGDDGLLGYRYVAGIVFGSFMMLPYVIYLYPLHLAPFFGGGFLELFAGPNTSVGEGIPVILPPFMVITGVVLFFTGAPLLRGAIVSVKMRRPTTDLLVGVTVTGAYVYSVLAMLMGRLDVYFDLTVVVAASVVAAMYYEALLKRDAAQQLTDLTQSQVNEALVYAPDGEAVRVPGAEVDPGDRILVRQGERVPIDGVLAEGECMVDESVVTGESLPRLKERGDPIIGGSVVTDGSAVLTVDEATTSRMEHLTAAVWDIQSATHGLQRRADRIATFVIPGLLAAAVVIGLASLYLTTDAAGALLVGLLVLLVGAPWAVGLATPLSAAAGIKNALERGIVVFDETIFERLRDVDVVVFDKTGTLTTGQMEVIEAAAPTEALAAAAALERHSSHPIGEAITTEFSNADPAVANGGTNPSMDGPATNVTAFESHAKGVSGRVDGTPVKVGHPELFTEANWEIGDTLESQVTTARDAGHLPVVIGRDGTAEGLVRLGDRPRSDWTDAVTRLADTGIRIVVLTGDDEPATEFLTDHPGITHVFAGIHPEGKTAAIRQLQQTGTVSMVGDGTNDAPALATADLGISMGGGTALASEAADLVVLENDLDAVAAAFDLAETIHDRVTQNNRLALVYNAIVIPLAVLGALNPLFAMVAVILTGGLIALNANRTA